MTDIFGDERDTLSFDVVEPEAILPGPANQHVSAGSVETGLKSVAVIVVGFHNADDIAENGGNGGVAALNAALMAPGSPCQVLSDARLLTQLFPDLEGQTFNLSREDAGTQTHVHVVRMRENLGYAGAINACLRPLLMMPGWDAAWILNPDTEPTPSALCELADYAAKRRKGMVGSRITAPAEAAVFCCRGLKWSKLTASTAAIGIGDPPTDNEVDPDLIEPLLDAPSGASMYVTRDLIERIGLMDERYFLYFEDLDWGCRAKTVGAVGYAHRSVVPHKGGTTIGSANYRAGKSRLSVYLEFRNRILFVRARHGKWLAWATLMQLVHLAVYFASGSVGNMFAGGRGVLAGLRGEIGRPDRILQAHRGL
jgi:GT2 family glycosyltransferase